MVATRLLPLIVALLVPSDILLCSGAQPYHQTVPDGGITVGMGRTAQSLMGPFVYLALVGDVPRI